MVKFSKTPVDKLKDAFVRVYDDVLRLDVAVHDALAVAEIQGFQQFI